MSSEVLAHDSGHGQDTAVPGSGAVGQLTSACWEAVVQKVAGACKLRNVPPHEALAVAGWLEALESELDHECTAADRSVLGSLGRVALLEFRLSRSCFGEGIQQSNGRTRDTLTELRQIIRLKADLLSKLRFTGAPIRDVQSIADLWRDDDEQTQELLDSVSPSDEEKGGGDE